MVYLVSQLSALHTKYILRDIIKKKKKLHIKFKNQVKSIHNRISAHSNGWTLGLEACSCLRMRKTGDVQVQFVPSPLHYTEKSKPLPEEPRLLSAT